jgi:hydroxyethylthiazole kinase-like uncharacterized protein yjeF
MAKTPNDVLLLTAAEAAAADRAAERAGVPLDRLMDAAGRAVAAAARGMLTADRGGLPVAILCGPGGNGGDGFVAARILAGWGVPVVIHADRLPSADTAAGRAMACCGLPIHPLSAFAPDQASLVVDALYGAGLTRAITGAEAAALQAAAQAAQSHDLPVLAVDLPSGLDADTGQPLGPHCPAARTITFFRRKPVHLLWPGRALCGVVSVAEIGLEIEHLREVRPAPSLWANGPALWTPLTRPLREAERHKYQRGHVHVLSGPPLRTGASRLSAQAALHAGAGAVTLVGDEPALMVHAAHVTAVMLAPLAKQDGLPDLLQKSRSGALVAGPALGLDARANGWLSAAMASAAPLVLDADALTLLAYDFKALRAQADSPLEPARPVRPLVLTPHAGEFERLFVPRLGDDPTFAALPARLQASKVEKARAAARLCGGVVVFKGVDTVIAAPDGRAAINHNAGPELATAGSGDVLAGVIAAHVAAGHPPFEAAAAAVWLHGAIGAEVAATFGEGLTAERLVAALRPLTALQLG